MTVQPGYDPELGGPPTDPYDATLAISATGVLADFNRAGVLAGADVHVATRLGGLFKEQRDAVRLALALAVRALRTGSVCLDLATVASQLGAAEHTTGLPWPEQEAWLAQLRESPLIAPGIDSPARPGRLVGTLLYLEKYWQQEQLVAAALDQRIGSPRVAADLDLPLLRDRLRELLPGAAEDRQRLAAAVAVTSVGCVIAGGPGTGKTRTVARLLAALRGQPGPPPRIALAAPTGKAAARLGESVAAALAELTGEDRRLLAHLTPLTLHRLLGSRGLTSFRHGPDNHLAYDVVVVDETSMVSLSMMAMLLSALAPTTRLVLVGDPDQLASVEAGAVLADVVARAAALDRSAASVPHPVEQVAEAELRELEPAEQRLALGAVVRLRHRFRFGDGGIARFADAVVAGDADSALALLRSGDPQLDLIELEPAPAEAAVKSAEHVRSAEQHAADLYAALTSGRLQPVRDAAGRAGRTAFEAAARAASSEAFAAVSDHQVLAAHRHGPFGAATWSSLIERWLVEDVPGYRTEDPWYLARPVLVRANDSDLGVFNGDAGIVVRSGADGRRVAFGGSLLISPARLPSVETVHALTIHKSQGSQYRRVSLILPPPQSPLLTRELLYTAVTRASERVCVVASVEAVRAAIGRPVVRASGLRMLR